MDCESSALQCLKRCTGALTEDQRFHVALRCLDSFVGANFAGLLEVDGQTELSVLQDAGNLSDFARQELSFHLNTPFCRVRCIEQLWIAKEIFAQNSKPSSLLNHFEWYFWRFRFYRIWSSILLEKSPELKKEIDSNVANLDSIIDSKNDQLPRQIVFQYWLEKSAFKAEFFEHSDAKLALEKAAKLIDMEVSLDGALGRRTRFQLESVAQLFVSTKSSLLNEGFDDESTPYNADLPINCQNSDDTLLQNVKLDNDINEQFPELSEWQLLYVLALSLEKFHAWTELDFETSMAFVEEVIRHRKNWSIQIRALIERSVLERKNKRRVERACSQMEHISKMLDNFEDYGVSSELRAHRLRLIYSTSPMPFWAVRKVHADVLRSLGCIAESLVIYESLEMWDEVVQCYRGLSQLEKAERIVRDLLVKNPNNAIYHCVLGDITNNFECYIEAIKVSDDRCARASASMGQLFLCRKQYDKALACFQRSVQLQPYQIGIWFNLGHCAMQMENYREGSKAYHRCVTFEPEHFEAWNNLAACYVSLGQKERAQKVLQESIKLKHDNWKVWENLVLISADIDDFRTAIIAITRMLDMDTKRKIDDLPLEMIVGRTLELPAANVENLRNSLAEILSRVSARQSMNSRLLKLYARLKKPSADSADLIAWSKYLQLLERALQQESSENSTMSGENFALQLEGTLELIAEMQNVWRIKEMQESQISSQIKLRIRPLLSTIERTFGKECENSQNERLKAAFSKASSMIK